MTLSGKPCITKNNFKKSITTEKDTKKTGLHPTSLNVSLPQLKKIFSLDGIQQINMQARP